MTDHALSAETETPLSSTPADDGSGGGAEPARSATPMRALKWVSLAVILGSLLAVVSALPVGRGVEALEDWVQGQGFFGVVVFGVVYILAALLFLPGSALTLAAGAVFGVFKGTAIVSVASTTTAALAYLIARFFARKKVEEMAGRYPKFRAVDGAIGTQGWRIVFLLRLSPAFPFSASNYLYGLTAIRFWPLVLASWVAMLPGTFMYVYLGALSGEGLSAVGGEGGGKSPGEWALLVVGFLATVVVTVYVTKIARKALAQAQREEAEAGGTAIPEPEQAEQVQPTSSRGTWITAGVAVAFLVLAGWVQANKASLQGIFGPPKVTLEEAYVAVEGGAEFDHSAFDALLAAHVDGQGRVDYAALAEDPGALDGYLAQLADAPFEELDRDQKLALLINAYNAFTLRLILDYYPVASIKDLPLGKQWDDVRWDLGGRALSLNQIEHEEIRPKFREARIHFALVCAAVGCPPLRAEAYQAERLEAQLAAQNAIVHADPRWFELSEDGESVRLTALYQWYGGDFEQEAGSVLAFAARESAALRALLDAGREPAIEWIDYDWSLNEQKRKP